MKRGDRERKSKCDAHFLSVQEERVREEKRLAEIMEENNQKIAEAQRKLVS